MIKFWYVIHNIVASLFSLRRLVKEISKAQYPRITFKTVAHDKVERNKYGK
jgi:hypothetical protein